MNRNRYNEIHSAMRRQDADLTIKNVNVVDVFSSKILKNHHVAVVGSTIVGISETPYSAKKEIDGTGKTLIPGLIDPHIHTESSYITPDAFIKIVAQHGTTTAMVDFHELANTNGEESMKYYEGFTKSPFNLLLWIPSCVPASKWEHCFQPLEADKLEKMLEGNNVIGLGEMMDFFGVSEGRKEVIEKIAMCHNKGLLIDGHSSFDHEDRLNAYLSQNITAEHECNREDQVYDRIARGFQINLRHGDKSKNLPELIHTVNKDNLSFFSICGDDINAEVLLNEGHLDRAYKSVKDKIINISHIDLVKMMTINTARANNMRYVGGIAPGYRADLVLIDSLEDFNVLTTISNGEVIWDGKEHHHLDFDVPAPKSNFLHKVFNENDFDVNFETENEFAILAESFATYKTTIKVKNENGIAVPEESGVAKISIIDRYNRTNADNFTCFVKDFKIHSGAVAQTINHDSHNTVVVGVSESDMAIAVNELKNMGGGFVAVKDGQIISKVTLAIGGLMSDKHHDEFINEWNSFMEAVKVLLEKDAENPVLKLRGIGLSVIPVLRITLHGLLEVETDTILKRNFKLNA